MRGILTRLTEFPVGSGQREDIVLLIESTPAACTDEHVRDCIQRGDFDVVVMSKCRFDADAWTFTSVFAATRRVDVARVVSLSDHDIGQDSRR